MEAAGGKGEARSEDARRRPRERTGSVEAKPASLSTTLLICEFFRVSIKGLRDAAKAQDTRKVGSFEKFRSAISAIPRDRTARPTDAGLLIYRITCRSHTTRTDFPNEFLRVEGLRSSFDTRLDPLSNSQLHRAFSLSLSASIVAIAVTPRECYRRE